MVCLFFSSWPLLLWGVITFSILICLWRFLDAPHAPIRGIQVHFGHQKQRSPPLDLACPEHLKWSLMGCSTLVLGFVTPFASLSIPCKNTGQKPSCWAKVTCFYFSSSKSLLYSVPVEWKPFKTTLLWDGRLSGPLTSWSRKVWQLWTKGATQERLQVCWDYKNSDILRESRHTHPPKWLSHELMLKNYFVFVRIHLQHSEIITSHVKGGQSLSTASSMHLE